MPTDEAAVASANYGSIGATFFTTIFTAIDTTYYATEHTAVYSTFLMPIETT